MLEGFPNSLYMGIFDEFKNMTGKDLTKNNLEFILMLAHSSCEDHMNNSSSYEELKLLILVIDDIEKVSKDTILEDDCISIIDALLNIRIKISKLIANKMFW